MPDPSNSSFIPKRGPAKKSRTATTKRVYLFAVISFVLMFSAVLGSGGVYFYKGTVQESLKTEVTLLNEQINTFSDLNMQRVLEFNRRLEQAQSRLDAGISIPSLFTALEESTARTVKIKSLEITRENDERLTVEGELETSTFDSTIFQRRLYQDNPTIGAVQIAEFNASNIEGGFSSRNENAIPPTLVFSVELNIPFSLIPATITRSVTPSAVISDFDRVPFEDALVPDSDEYLIDNNIPL
jgi:hypothetical protein